MQKNRKTTQIAKQIIKDGKKKANVLAKSLQKGGNREKEKSYANIITDVMIAKTYVRDCGKTDEEFIKSCGVENKFTSSENCINAIEFSLITEVTKELLKCVEIIELSNATLSPALKDLYIPKENINKE